MGNYLTRDAVGKIKVHELILLRILTLGGPRTIGTPSKIGQTTPASIPPMYARSRAIYFSFPSLLAVIGSAGRPKCAPLVWIRSSAASRPFVTGTPFALPVEPEVNTI